jgi:hypothetical protein
MMSFVAPADIIPGGSVTRLSHGAPCRGDRVGREHQDGRTDQHSTTKTAGHTLADGTAVDAVDASVMPLAVIFVAGMGKFKLG